MRGRSAWVAWGLLAVYTVSLVALLVLSAANGNLRQESLTDTVALLLAFSASMVVGVLIVAHRPGNAVGWLFGAIGLLAVIGGLGEGYVEYGYLTRPGSLPVPVLAAWLAAWTWYPALALALVFIPLLFPTGRLPSLRWWPVAWLAGLATAAITTMAALQPTLAVVGDRRVANPIGVAAIGNPEEGPVGVVLFNLFGLLTVASFASVVVRFRRSRGEERLQLKWFTYAGVMVPLAVPIDLVPDPLGSLLFAAVIACLPVAAGVAILRYRLFEIDRLINRTLVYGLLTALLAGVYAGLVLLGGLLFGDLGERAPSWAVAGATLAVAALFQPARRRIQRVVDRRFNRRRYDAARTVEAFSGRLRQELDLDSLSAELLAVAEQTMQPTTASLWLRPTAKGPTGAAT